MDLGPFYDQVPSTPEDSVVDIGCGTGNALDYLPQPSSYVGFDTDALAIQAAREKWRAADFARFEHGECRGTDIQNLEPTRVILCGVLHHLPDDAAVPLLRAAAKSPRFRTIHTLDVAYFDGARHFLSNRLASMDRGRFVRTPGGYLELMNEAGLQVSSTREFWNTPSRRLAKYFTMRIER